MEEFLRFLITPLLSQPDELHISTSAHTIVLDTSPQDAGHVIGKHGSIIHAIRTLAKTYSISHKLPFFTIVLNSPAPPPAKTD